MPDRRAGLLVALVSAAAFSTGGVLAAALMDAGWSAAAAVVVRVGVGALVLTVPALAQLRGRWGALRDGVRPVLAMGLVAVAGCQLAYFLAVQRLSVGVALLLMYTAVVLVVGWTWWRQGQRPGVLTGAGVAATVLGLVLVLDVGGGARIDAAGVVWGLLAAVGLAGYFLVPARAEGALPPLVTAWGGFVVGAAALGGAVLVGLVPWRAVAAPVVLAGHPTSWLVPVLGLGVVAAALAYGTGIAATRRLGSRLASVVGLTEVLFAVALAALLLGQAPGPAQLGGGAVVLVGIVLVRLGEGGVDAGPEPVPAVG